MGRSNLIPITKIYDIYPKYSYSKDVRRFMDDIVDIDRADVYTKDEVITMLKDLKTEIERYKMTSEVTGQGIWNQYVNCCSHDIQRKINATEKEEK